MGLEMGPFSRKKARLFYKSLKHSRYIGEGAGNPVFRAPVGALYSVYRGICPHFKEPAAPHREGPPRREYKEEISICRSPGLRSASSAWNEEKGIGATLLRCSNSRIKFFHHPFLPLTRPETGRRCVQVTTVCGCEALARPLVKLFVLQTAERPAPARKLVAEYCATPKPGTS